MRFAGGINTGKPGNGSLKLHGSDAALIREQWKAYNLKIELGQAQAKIKRLQWLVGDLSMLVEVLQDNGILVDMMSDEDQMVIRHLMETLK